MPVRYKIVKDLQLLYTVFSGRVDKTDAFNFAREICSSPALTDVRKSLIFLKESQLIYTVSDVEDFGREIVYNKKFSAREKMAIIISNPNDTVAATIFAHTIRNNCKDVAIELFCTIDAALSFLDLTGQKEKIDELINEYSSILDDE
ncbi:MAG: hypothetical protein JXB34_13185 [Bacteroidales bacterium]|nr:hypothetical protein [Bacteroidales bacterium]